MTQGKTWNNNETCCAAAHAVDKDLATPAITYAASGWGWIRIEFDKTYDIHKIVIYNMFYINWYSDAHSWCVRGEAYFRACIDKGNNVDVSVYQGEVLMKSCGTLRLTYGLEQSDQIYTMICFIEGNTVKFSKSSGDIGLYEVVAVELLEGKYKFSDLHAQIIQAVSSPYHPSILNRIHPVKIASCYGLWLEHD